jgi:tellurite resistance protein/peptidoglycan hydrolase-like protein with peptidoglycan-binding domain
VAKRVGSEPRWTLLLGVALIGAAAPVRALAQPVAALEIRTIQFDLQALGFDPGPADGRWGRQSLQALRRFQRGEGLAETGRADRETVVRLQQRRRPDLTATSSPAERRTTEGAQDAALVAVSGARGPNAATPTQTVPPSGPDLTRPQPPEPPDGSAGPALTSPAMTDAHDIAQTVILSGMRPAPVSPPSIENQPGRGASWVWALAPGGLLALWAASRRRRGRSLARVAALPSIAATEGPLGSDYRRVQVVTPISIPDAPTTVPPWVDSGRASPPGRPSPALVEMPSRATFIPALGTVLGATSTSGRVGSDALPPQAQALVETPVAIAPPKVATSPHRLAGDRVWVPAGRSTLVAGFELPGLVYFGHTLPPAKGYGRNDHCLIDPRLPVAKSSGDASGQHMDYWPAYESMRPSSRRALLEWLSGDRSDPGTYIGYVFVHLYGLERRAVLEGSVEDRPTIRTEVERLLATYGNNGSFRRYASDLLAAIDVLDLAPGRDPDPVFLACSADLPAPVRIAVGRRIRDGRPVEADWLLAWTMSHPETRVRTAARRAFDHLRVAFAAEFERRNPSGGLLLTAEPGRTSPLRYRAASGTFEVDLGSDRVGALPDLAQFPEALACGREILDLCTDRLDAYSRHIGRCPTGASTLQALALLPWDARERALGTASREDLAWLAAHADHGGTIPFADVSDRLSGQAADRATPARLRELGDTLCRLGLGLIPDPRFPARHAGVSAVMLFSLDAPIEIVAAPSDAYKAAFLALSVGMLVAMADGEVTDDERTVLRELAAVSPGLSADERRRLAADASWLEAHPTELPSLRTRLAELGAERRQIVGDMLVHVASSDGRHDWAEIALLEKVFRHMGLERDRLYAALHRSGSGQGTAADHDGSADELVHVSLGDVRERTYAIPGAPLPALQVRATPPARKGPLTPSSRHAEKDPQSMAPASGVDTARLAAIRAETAAVSLVLADVFDDAETVAQPVIAPEAAPAAPNATEAVDAFAGLDSRHVQFLRELAVQTTWPRPEFERLAREFGLMAGAAMENLNAWAFERFDDILVEDGDPIQLNLHLLPEPLPEAA